MLNITLRIAASTFLLLKRIALGLALLLVVSVAGMVLTLRYSVLPDISRYHHEITQLVGKAIGLEIEIGKIEADWNGIGPHMLLADIRVLDKQGRTTLALKKVDIVVSWMTLLTGKLRLASLEIDQPELLVKRDARGVLTISGVKLEENSTDNDFANMLLNQSRIVVRDAKISWRDEKLAAPLLVFNDVNLLIENGWNSHRFAVRATPPAKLSTRLDVRGNFHGKSFDDLQGWSGEVFTELEYADLAAWKTWLPIPDALKQGRGALRGWMSVKAGEISQLTTDLALVDVQTRLGADLPPLNVRVLSGRLGWRDLGQGFEVSMNKFSLKLFNNFVLKPTDVLVRLNNVQENQAASGEVNANLLDLEGLGKLMEYLPLQRRFKEKFAAFSPQGRVENLKARWQTDAASHLSYRIKGKFLGMSLQRVGNLPGFSGLSAEIDGNEQSGSLLVNSPNLKLDVPEIMPDPLILDTIVAQLGWQSNTEGYEVKLRNIALANADLAGTAYGSYQVLANSPGRIDLTAHLSRANVSRAHKYIPLIALNKEALNWLKNSLSDGKSHDLNLRLKGDMKDFPFADSKTGIFKINAHAKAVAIEYAPDWPRIENAAADLLIQGKTLTITSAAAMTAGVKLKNIRVSIPDILSKDLMLHIRGEAEGENTRVLEYIGLSPIRGYAGGFTDDMVVRGNGNLKIAIDIPLSKVSATKVSGKYHFTNSEVEYGKYLPTMRMVNGDLLIGEKGVSTKNISAQILGGPAKLVIDSLDNGAMNIKLIGRANFEALGEINSHSVLRRLRGDPAWNVEMEVRNKLGNMLLTSTLEGLQSELPAPFSKRAKDTMALRYEMKDISASREISTLQISSLLNAGLVRVKDDDGDWKIKSGLINFGGAGKKSGRDGIWLAGTLPLLSLEGWGGLGGAADGDNGGAFRIKGADILIQKLTGYGNTVNDLHINAHTRSGVLTAHLASKEMNGEVSWQAGGWQAGALYSGENGRLHARLKNLDLGVADNNDKNEPGFHPVAEDAGLKTASAVDALPTVDLVIDRLGFKGRQMGKLELLAQQRKRDYQLDYLRLINPDGVLAIDGKWKMTEDEPQTQVNLKLEISNAGNILSRYGYPNSVKNGSGKLEGIFSWPGTPEMLSKSTLSGKLSLDTGKGQFLQIDPGIGKLLSILSLQALPKRITLDFEDVFSKGFEFDNINGSAEIRQGVMKTDNLKIEGTAAKVLMVGQVDLEKETQDMRIRVVPTVGNSAALISALVATPVIGAGVFLASKIFGDPLGQLASFEYKITGSWIDPKVEKVGETKAASKQEN